MNIFQVYFARIRAKFQVAVAVVVKWVKIQQDIVAIDGVPARLEDGSGQDKTGGSIVMQGHRGGLQLHDFGKVNGSSGVVPNRNKLAFGEGFTVELGVLGVRVNLGARGAVGKHVRDERRARMRVESHHGRQNRLWC